MELFRFPAHGGFSVRSILTFVLTVFTAALLWATFSSTPSLAADNATWTDGDVLLFDGHGFNQTNDALNTTSGVIPSDATIYRSAIQPSGSASSSKVFIIYFSSGVDPPTATTAKYVEFDYSGNKLSNPQNARDITVTPKGSDDSLGGEVNSSCTVGGIGWIICPVSVFLAESMDNLFSLLAGLIETQPPILSDPNNGMYVAWNVARTIANVAFVIVFLIIIYSQLTSFGISNYGIKKLTPRLIVAAVLVNISFYISAAAIDLSNILGYGIQDVFNIIREQTFNLTNDNFAGVNNNGWTAVTGVVLAGGGIIGGIYYAAAAGPYFLVTILVTLGLLLLFVLIVLAARQAIILLLVIVSPLAFVANLLPNTEKWFGKWRDLFTTMLIFFPAFSLVFGGSQLAGQLIIQNAGDNIITVIFGMAVQVAPLVITPLILKFSGGLLGRIAQLTNDPKKGLIDRTKGWQKQREEIRKNNAAARPASWRRPGSAMVKGMETLRNGRQEQVELAKLRAKNAYNQTGTHHKLHDKMDDAKQDEKLIHAELEKHSQNRILTNKDALLKDMKIRNAENTTVDLKGRIEATYGELKANDGSVSTRYGAEFAPLEQEAYTTARTIAANALRQANAKREFDARYFAEMKENSAAVQIEGKTLREYAGGIQGHVGAQRALAQAISEKHAAHAEVIKNANAILDDYNLDADSNLLIAQNDLAAGQRLGIEITADIQEAAIKRVAGGGVIPHINTLLTSGAVDWSPDGNEDFRLALVEALRGNSSRPKYIGYGTLDKLTQGIRGENGAPDGVTNETLNNWIESTMLNGKLSAKELAGQDEDTVKRVLDALPAIYAKPRTADQQATFNATLSSLQQEIHSARSDSILWNAAGERKKHIRAISGLLEGYTGIQAIPAVDVAPTVPGAPANGGQPGGTPPQPTPGTGPTPPPTTP